MSETVEQAQARYAAAAHAMQSGVAMKMNYDPGDTELKHLRVGVNSAHVSQSALAKLLIEKGLISEEELFTALADAMEAEKALYETTLSDHVGRPVTLH